MSAMDGVDVGAAVIVGPPSVWQLSMEPAIAMDNAIAAMSWRPRILCPGF